MYLKNIEILNFKILKKLNFELNKNINVFIGKNAQGKTSILESIYFLALTKSLINNEELNLINNNSDFAKVKGTLKKNNKTKYLEIILDKNKKILKINNNVEKKVSNYISNINVIMFSPEDLDIIKKSPGSRRNLLNIELCQLFPNYLRILNEYNKILKMRNEYFKLNFSKINKDYLNILTERLIDRAILIMKYRKDFIDIINKYIDNSFYKIMKVNGLKLIYEPSFNSYDKNELINIFNKNYDNELNKRTTLYGPHRDDFSFILNDQDLKYFGSQGQQRVAILSLKLSEINLFKEITGDYPIVLLDDIFSELDLEKRKNLLKFIKSNIQFIITTTDLNNISEKIIEKSNVFKIKEGNLVK